MPNIIISQNKSCNNEYEKSKRKITPNFGRYIEAPKSLPKYSIDKVLEEKDEFRRTITKNQNENLYKKKNNNFFKLGMILAAVGGFFLIKNKKLIK
ncbi:TPA: hypothetical protein IAA87_07350 [Candidatus Avigastranaerophilus faecigallinarum]|nr:hypothetical protein [Candidatus Avigastranaerophilus faecigallinarum]